MVQAWFNPDKLYLKYGPDKATSNKTGEYDYDGPTHYVETVIDLSTLTASPTIISDVYTFPKNARIEKVTVVTQTAATGAGAVLNVGLVQSADRTTAIDADGFVAALPLASMDAAGETTVLVVGSTYAGTSIGTTNATVGLITADYDTAAFTAGQVKVRIEYSAV